MSRASLVLLCDRRLNGLKLRRIEHLNSFRSVYTTTETEKAGLVASARLVSWKKRPGEKVTQGDVIAVVDFEKVCKEVLARQNGTFVKPLVKEQEVFNINSDLYKIAVVREEDIQTFVTNTSLSGVKEATSSSQPPEFAPYIAFIEENIQRRADDHKAIAAQWFAREHEPHNPPQVCLFSSKLQENHSDAEDESDVAEIKKGAEHSPDESSHVAGRHRADEEEVGGENTVTTK